MDTERYQIISELASGRDVRSWKATDLTTGRMVHLKELYLEHVDSWKAVELFNREVETLAQLEHARIPRLLDSWQETGESTARFGLAREWVEGEPLRAHLDDLEPVDEQEVRRVLEQIAHILVYLHDFRPPVVHRDLTPDHVIRDEDGHLHLVGFAGVQAALPKTQGGSTFVGTSGYVAPEQLMGKAQPASDIYALGATCIALLAGLPPADLPTENMRLRFEDHVEASPALVALLKDMVAPMADRRPGNATKLLRRLEHLDEELTRYAARLLDDPAPDALKVWLNGTRLMVWPHVRFTRRTLQLLTTIPAGLTLMLAFGLFLIFGKAVALLIGAFLGLLAGVMTLLVVLPTAFIPYSMNVDEQRIFARGWLRSIPLDAIDEIEIANGSDNPLVVWAHGRPRTVRLPITPTEAEWLADRIRERMRRDDD